MEAENHEFVMKGKDEKVGVVWKRRFSGDFYL